MGNTTPRHSFKLNVDPDYSSAGSNESLPSPRCYRYNMTQGKSQGQHVTPTLMKEMSCDNLQHLCCSSDGTVWVCRRPQIIQLDGKGHTLLLLEVKIEICGLAASKHGELVFTDGKNKRLVSTRFEDDVITKKVMSTNDWYPIGVCFAENGDIIVGLFLPSTRGSVIRYTEDGDTRYTLENDNNGCPMFCFPAFVTENGNGDVVVSDHLKRAVITVDRWGRYRFSYIADKLNRPDAVPFLPFGVCCDSSLNIIISDCCNDCLHLVSVNGEFLYMLLTKASGLYRPVALSMSKNGNLYVGDRNGIKIFHMDTHRGASDDRKSSRTNSLSSLETNRTSGNTERTPPLERLRAGSQSVASTKLKRSSTEKNMSSNAMMNSTGYSKSYFDGGGGIKTNPMASSYSFPNKSATLPLKASLTNVTSGFCSPLTSRRTNTLMNASRAAPFSSSSSSSTSLASSTSSLSPASPKKSPLLSSTKTQQQQTIMTSSQTTMPPLGATTKTQKNAVSSAEKLEHVTSSSVPSKTVTCNSSTNPTTCVPVQSLPTTSGSTKTIFDDKDKSTISNSKQSGIVKGTAGRANPATATTTTTTTTTTKVTVNSGRGVKQKDREVCGPKEMVEGASQKSEQCQNEAGTEQRGGSGGLPATQQLPSAGKALPHTTAATAKSASNTTSKAATAAAAAKPSATTKETVVMNKTATSKTTPPPTAATSKTTATKTTAIINKTTTTQPAARTTKSATATKTTSATVVRRTDESNALKSDGSASVTSPASANQTAFNKSSTGEKRKQRDSNIIESTRI